MNDIQPCPVCQSSMKCYNTADISGEAEARSHYLLACVGCGDGPTQAFPTFVEAINHWNIAANGSYALRSGERA